MSHLYHDDLPGFDARQVWKSGCPECEMRGRSVPDSLGTLDEERFAYAWKRAADWNRMHGPDVGPVSDAERPLLTCLWRFQVALERVCKLPIGELPTPPIKERPQHNWPTGMAWRVRSGVVWVEFTLDQSDRATETARIWARESGEPSYITDLGSGLASTVWPDGHITDSDAPNQTFGT